MDIHRKIAGLACVLAMIAFFCSCRGPTDDYIRYLDTQVLVESCLDMNGSQVSGPSAIMTSALADLTGNIKLVMNAQLALLNGKVATEVTLLGFDSHQDTSFYLFHSGSSGNITGIDADRTTLLDTDPDILGEEFSKTETKLIQNAILTAVPHFPDRQDLRDRLCLVDGKLLRISGLEILEFPGAENSIFAWQGEFYPTDVRFASDGTFLGLLSLGTQALPALAQAGQDMVARSTLELVDRDHILGSAFAETDGSFSFLSLSATLAPDDQTTQTVFLENLSQDGNRTNLRQWNLSMNLVPGINSGIEARRNGNYWWLRQGSSFWLLDPASAVSQGISLVVPDNPLVWDVLGDGRLAILDRTSKPGCITEFGVSGESLPWSNAGTTLSINVYNPDGTLSWTRLLGLPPDTAASSSRLYNPMGMVTGADTVSIVYAVGTPGVVRFPEGINGF